MRNSGSTSTVSTTRHHLDQLLPVPAVTGEPRDLARGNGANLAETDLATIRSKPAARHREVWLHRVLQHFTAAEHFPLQKYRTSNNAHSLTQLGAPYEARGDVAAPHSFSNCGRDPERRMRRRT